MAINSVSNYQSLIATLGALNVDSTQTSATSQTLLDALNSDSSSSESSQASTSTTISQTATLLSALSKISSNDPEKFKEITKGVADDLNAAAEDSSDPVQAYTLQNLASQFSNAAISGSLSDITSSTLAGNFSSSGSALKGYGSSGKSFLSSYFSTGQAQSAVSTVNTLLTTNIVESYTKSNT